MKIKNLVAALAVSAMMSAPAMAQAEELETRHEIGISYGTVPNSIWIDIVSDAIPAIFGEKHDHYKYVGPIGLEYYYHTSPLIGVGAVAVFATNNEDAYVKEKLDGHRIRSYYTLMPSIKFNWLRKNNWGLYSKLAAGATLASFKDQDYDDNGKLVGDRVKHNEAAFNFQVSLIGVEAGGSHARGFIELGVGEQGIALAGLRYKF